jgi:mannose-6-phosphate isomerase-like protein (cupin superfamily)
MPPEQKTEGEVKVTNFDEAIQVVDNAKYKIQDLNLVNTKGSIAFTVSITVLKPGQQTTGHTHQLNDEFYEFIEGEGFMMIGREAKAVKAGDFIVVERTNFHKVINVSNASALIFRCYFTGQIKRPHLIK